MDMIDLLLTTWIGIFAFVFAVLFVFRESSKLYNVITRTDVVYNFNLLYIGIALSYIITYLIKLF